jgi:hypothetical protein
MNRNSASECSKDGSPVGPFTLTGGRSAELRSSLVDHQQNGLKPVIRVCSELQAASFLPRSNETTGARTLRLKGQRLLLPLICQRNVHRGASERSWSILARFAMALGIVMARSVDRKRRRKT